MLLWYILNNWLRMFNSLLQTLPGADLNFDYLIGPKKSRDFFSFFDWLKNHYGKKV